MCVHENAACTAYIPDRRAASKEIKYLWYLLKTYKHHMVKYTHPYHQRCKGIFKPLNLTHIPFS